MSGVVTVKADVGVVEALEHEQLGASLPSVCSRANWRQASKPGRPAGKSMTRSARLRFRRRRDC
jgi:hypothetical protein